MRLLDKLRINFLQSKDTGCKFHEFSNISESKAHSNAKQHNGESDWTDAAIAVHQAGGIRGSIGSDNLNKVTLRDVRNALPFGEPNIFKVKVKGSTLHEALEWSVNDRISQNETAHGGAFLQMSGIRVIYDLSKDPNSRVVSVKVRCSICTVPTYNDLDMETTYSVLMPGFMHLGGDGYKMMKNLPYVDTGMNSSSVVVEYINHTSPVYPNVEGRISFINQINIRNIENGSAGRMCISALAISAIALLLPYLISI
ncbi:hypothetical protein QAD02_023151 [Eretmocerus hayati]|uniref:Uncharacterized protein n=1 Tax=Eretmocerus hayati TaxID=131215 RepID=A0ACC2PYD7_9HYME|nr:hypothetical protein QAD02_023151 [Eretmocerus hayati]